MLLTILNLIVLLIVLTTLYPKHATRLLRMWRNAKRVKNIVDWHKLSARSVRIIKR